MNMSILVAGSSRRNLATAAQCSRFTRAHSFPRLLPSSTISPPVNCAVRRSRTICAIEFTDLSRAFQLFGANRGDRDVVAPLGLDRDLAVTLALLDAVLQQHQRV